MKSIKCKHCGKPYASPGIMRTKKCQKHPKGMWRGWCEPDYADDFLWSLENQIEQRKKRAAEQERKNRQYEAEKAEFLRKYKRHTPLIDCMLDYYPGGAKPAGISNYDLQIRHANLNQLSLALANGMNEQSRDAINTIYALRAGCEHVLSNPEAQDEGSLNTWSEKITLLKDEVVNREFWLGVYWLTKSVSSAEDFHTKQVLPMLHVLRGESDEKDRIVKGQVEKRLLEARSKYRNFEKEIDALLKRIGDYTFWGVLYCLYWMKLRPTPWNDQKVWPIKVAAGNSAASSLTTTKCHDFAEKLRNAYAKNFTPFKSLWIFDGDTLVFDRYSVGRKVVKIDVGVWPGGVNVTLFMKNGNLADVQAFASKNAQLMKLFPEIKDQRLQHSKITYAEAPAFIDQVLAALRSPAPKKADKPESKPGVSIAVQCSDFVKMLRDAYSKNYTPFKKLWIYKEKTLVFDEYFVGKKVVAIDVGVSTEGVNVTLFMRNGNLNDVQAFANGNAKLKNLFPETIAQRMRHTKIAHADVSAFIDSVLAALRAPTAEQSAKVDIKAKVPTTISSSDYAKKLRETYLTNFTPFKKLWIYNRNTLVFDGYSVNGKVVAIDVAILPDGANITLFMRNGNLGDVQAFASGKAELKKLFPEIVAQRLRHSKVAHSDVSAFLDNVLTILRS